MKHSTKILTAMTAIVIGLLTTNAQAGPGPHITYAPVKTAQEAEALKPKTRIAITCPMCGAVTTSVVDKEKSHMHGVACGACKATFEVIPVGSGKTTVTKLTCKDTKTGKKMPLQMCAEMH